ncbi:hypothetical protein B2G71_17315 [Novosphingobium sp. PC22D]|nr:ankyrin repeat domain-containing protein [Novosphingobium sp. PC22D]PEQ11323.1 hypothetical protein B2G71_17315 [Novosphingobium sp. PC22D]
MAGLVMALAATLAAPQPAMAQFSDGYKFLEAVKKKEGDKVEQALSEGSTIINSRDVTSGVTALHIVTERRDLTWLRYLVGKGANVNIRDAKGVTPLQLAVSLGWVDGVRFLVSAKSKLDETNVAGETPLISAVHRKDLTMTRILLDAGADPDRADNSGRSARDYARLEGPHSSILDAIEAKDKDEKKASSGETYGPTI